MDEVPRPPLPDRTDDERFRDAGVLARAWALRLLFRWLRQGQFPDANLERLGVPAEVRAFTMDLVYATVRWHGLLDAALRLLVRRRPTPDAEAAILLGLCQLLRFPSIPAYAAIHATVEAAKAIGNRRTPVGLVNATLRTADRYAADLREELSRAPLATRLSHPPELVSRWTERWGADRAAAICNWDNEPARAVLLPLPGGPSIAEIADSLRSSGIEAEPLPGYSGDALCLPHGHRVDDLPGFREGLFTVQDPATLAATDLLDVRPGQRVLDACAAPGGKAARLARTLGPGSRLVALDLHEDRLPALRQTLDRLVPDAASLVEVRAADASRVTADDLGGPFDRILLDVPCGNTGVLRRRVDARWRLAPGRMEAVRAAQRAILANAPALLAPGGRIVYSTCSIDAAENESQIDAFLAANPGFHLVASRLNLPGENGCDGAFCAALEPSPTPDTP